MLDLFQENDGERICAEVDKCDSYLIYIRSNITGRERRGIASLSFEGLFLCEAKFPITQNLFYFTHRLSFSSSRDLLVLFL